MPKSRVVMYIGANCADDASRIIHEVQVEQPEEPLEFRWRSVGLGQSVEHARELAVEYSKLCATRPNYSMPMVVAEFVDGVRL